MSRNAPWYRRVVALPILVVIWVGIGLVIAALIGALIVLVAIGLQAALTG